MKIYKMIAYRYRREWDNYGNWLVKRVGFKRRGYQKLMKFLHQSPFFAILEEDIRRIEDGKRLRLDYLEEMGLPIYIFDYEDCTVLELLVSFAIRMDDEWVSTSSEEHPEICFWDFLKNLGLDWFTNGRFDEDHVRSILGIWIKREFSEDGRGSIFPIEGTPYDQLEKDLWRQMTEYVSKNHKKFGLE